MTVLNPHANRGVSWMCLSRLDQTIGSYRQSVNTPHWRRAIVIVALLIGTVLLPASPALAGPHGLTTGVAVAASSSGNWTYVAATDKTSSTVGYDMWELGGNGFSFSPLGSLPGVCATTTSPAVSLVHNGGDVSVLARGVDGNVCVFQASFDHNTVSGWLPMGIVTNVAPGAGSSGDRTVAVVVATDGRIFYDWWDLGTSRHGFREVPGGGRTDAAVAVAAVNNGNYVFLLMKGTDGLLYGNQGTPGGGFTGWQSWGIHTNVAPGAASWGNRSVALVTATSGLIYYDWWDLGGGGHGFRPVPGGLVTDAGPAGSLVANGTYLFVLAKDVGSDADIFVNQGTVGGGFVGWGTSNVTGPGPFGCGPWSRRPWPWSWSGGDGW